MSNEIKSEVEEIKENADVSSKLLNVRTEER